MRQGVLALAGVVGALLVCSPAASAVTRHATVGGSGPSPCLPSAPCSLTDATSGAGAGDTVSVAPGTYTEAAGVSVAAAGVKIVGEPGGPPPVMRFTGGAGLLLGGAGSELRNVEVEAPNPAVAVIAAANAVVSDVEIRAAGGCLALQSTGATVENSKLTTTGTAPSILPCLGTLAFGAADGTTVRDVEVTSTATTTAGTQMPLVGIPGSGVVIDRLVATNPQGPALVIGAPTPGPLPSVVRRSRIAGAQNVAPPPGFPGIGALFLIGSVTVTDSLITANGTEASFAVQSSGLNKLRNVTAIGTGTNTHGLHVPAAFAGAGPGPTSVRNSIIRGEAGDVLVDAPAPAPPGCVPMPPNVPCGLPGGDLIITHSNFGTVTGTLNAASGDNQSADPRFANAAGGNFRLLAGSPAIDAGVDDPDNGTHDLDGRNRKIGSAVDLGAYEFQRPAQAPRGPGGGPPDVVPPPPAPPDRLAPGVSALALTNRRFRVGSQQTPVSTAAARRGTTFFFLLSEPARVTITIQRRAKGRRKGRRCVKPTRRLRRAKKCTRYVNVRGFRLTRVGIPGANAVPFSGRVGNRTLKPGRYRAVFAATDASGNQARRKPRVHFTVVKR